MIEPQTDLAIYRLFLWRCVECGHVATEINHIETRASERGLKNDWRNVPVSVRMTIPSWTSWRSNQP